MPEINRPYAAAMVFSAYPNERQAIHRIMREHNLKSTFDVVRLLANDPKAANVKKGDFNAVRYRK